MEEIFIFNGVAPGSENTDLKELNFEEKENDNTIKRISQYVSKPSLIPFIPKNPNGLCIMIIPGGGFKRLVISKEGSEIALWLNSLGITAFVLKHRMPGDGHKNANMVPLQDAQRGLRVIRSLSGNYGYDMDKIGVMGFSAGGHVASSLGTLYSRIVYNFTDKIDNFSAKPNFMALMYPVISVHSYKKCGSELPQHVQLNREFMDEFPTDTFINSDTPQTFIVVADDDKTTPSENSVNFYLGLRSADVPAEMHIFRKGSHGFGLAKTRGAVSLWTENFERWIRTLEFDEE